MILPGAAAAFGIFLARQFFIGIPDELIEAARIDGAGHLRIFLQVVLPLCKPLIAVLTLLTLHGQLERLRLAADRAQADPTCSRCRSACCTSRARRHRTTTRIMAMALVSVLPMVLLFLVLPALLRAGLRPERDQVTAPDMTYLCTLDLPDAWFDELSRRVPDVASIARLAGADPLRPTWSQRPTLLHTSEWFPDATAAPSLRCVQLDTSGVDHVRAHVAVADRRADRHARRHRAGARWPSTPCMSILELAHRMPLIDQLRRSRTWPTNADRLALLTPRQLAGATVGIVGYGRIGREISRLAARVRDARARAAPHRPTLCGSGEQFDTGRLDEAATRPRSSSRWSGSHEVLAASPTILVVVVPLTELTRGMIGAARARSASRTARWSSTSPAVASSTRPRLLERLRDGRIGGVALDVFDDEPLPADSAVVVGTRRARHAARRGPRAALPCTTLDLVVENLTRLAEGRPLLNEVDRVAGY